MQSLLPHQTSISGYVAKLHPDHEILQLLAYQHVEAQIDAHLQARILENMSQGTKYHFYTDGSLMYPTLVLARHAAYAIVLDSCPDDVARRLEADKYLVTQRMPDSLQTLSVARVTGRQTIYRAELYAVVKICEWFSNTLTHVDAEAVLDAVARCRSASSCSELVADADFDLVCRLWEALQSGDHQFQKVPAHTTPDATISELDRYRALGNQCANDAAIETNCGLYVREAAMLAARAKDIQTELDNLKQLYKLHLELHRARALFEQQAKQATSANVEQSDQVSQQQILIQWNIADCWQPSPARVDYTSRSVVGPRMAKSLLNWLRLIRWQLPEDMVPSDPGMTYMEMAVSYMLWSGLYLPLKRAKADGIMALYVPRNAAEATAQGGCLAEYATMFAYLLHQLAQLHHPEFMPDVARTACRSLYRLGAKQQAKGVSKRPVVPKQAEMVQMFSDIAVRVGYHLPQEGIDLNVTGDVDGIRGECIDSLALKMDSAKRAVQTVRQLRT